MDTNYRDFTVFYLKAFRYNKAKNMSEIILRLDVEFTYVSFSLNKSPLIEICALIPGTSSISVKLDYQYVIIISLPF